VAVSHHQVLPPVPVHIQNYGLGTPPAFQKFVCGKVLYNYDSLEPAERKLVI
jgi:hypothetical protein